MRLEDTIAYLVVTASYDTDHNPTETTSWVTLGKCMVVKSGAAQKITGADGVDYYYSFTVYMRLGEYIPEEGDTIHLTKKDGSVDVDCTVKGFTTMRNWVKIWA